MVDSETLKLLKGMPQVSVMGYDNGGFAIIANDDKYPAVLGICKAMRRTGRRHRTSASLMFLPTAY